MTCKIFLSVLAFLAFTFTSFSQTTPLWPPSSPEAQGMNSQTFIDALRRFRRDSTNIHSLLVIKNGHTVVDAYFYPFKKEYVHDMASVTKSVTALLIGIAIDKGFIKSKNEGILQYFPEYQTNNDTLKMLRIKDLLNMSSGLQCSWDDGENELNQMQHSTDWVKYMFSLPFETVPGEKFSYCSGNFYLLAEILQKASKMTCHAFAKKYLFAPLGFGETYWQANAKGVNHGWGDLHISTHDMAKIGYLVLNDGVWNGKQVISKGWLDKIKPQYKIQKTESYGYGWWLDSENPDEIQAIGRGGQRLFIFKKRKMVIATTGGGFESGDIDNLAIESIESFDNKSNQQSGLGQMLLDIQKPPVDNSVIDSKIRFSKAWLNSEYFFADNELGFASLKFELTGGKYFFIIRLKDGSKEEHGIGMGNGYEMSKEREFGLPVAVKGFWANDSTLVVDYNELCRIQDNKLTVAFSGKALTLTVTESTKNINQTLVGRQQ